MLPDYVALPPEINSAQMYTGPQSGSMWAAAAAWDGLAAELSSAASSFQSVVAGLNAAWQGPASMSMAAAAGPYVQWLTAASGQAEQVASQARLSAGAFEAAFMATVPPPAIAANRAQLMTLIATNLLGQNTAAIAATEAQYSEMWAQDVTAMTGYDATTTAAEAQWTPFAQPPAPLAGPAAATSSVSTGSGPLSWLTQSPLLSSVSTTMQRLEMLSTPAEFAMEPMNMLMGQFMTGANPLLGGAAGGVPPMDPVLASTASPVTGTASSVQLGARTVSAGMGQAGFIGPLSVPASWANTVSPTTPTQAVAAVPAAAVSDVGAGAPRVPQLSSMGTPGCGIGAAAKAVAAEPREAAMRYTVLG